MKKKTLSVGDSYEVSVGGSDDGSKITLDGQSITLGSQRIERPPTARSSCAAARARSA
ncbi:hypothetical protein P4123_09205 [Pseudomonas aeruginosa]|nr:hypothetical protein [Pseudomonas aeruginosa]